MRYNPLLHGTPGRWDFDRKPKGGGGGKDSDTPDYIPLRPANVSTGFGTARVDPESGNYTYTLDPRLSKYRDIFYGAVDKFLPTAETDKFASDITNQGYGLFGQGSEWLQQALATDPNQVGSKYYNDILNLQSAGRAQEEARLADSLFRTGRTGAAVSYDGGYLNPEQFALLKARQESDQGLAIQSEEYGRNRLSSDIARALGLQQSGIGLWGQGRQVMSEPYSTAAGILGLGTDVEKLGLIPMQVGLEGIKYQAMIQQAKQQIENASVDDGKGGGLLGGIVNTGLKMGANYLTNGLSSAAGSWSPLTNYTPVGGPGISLKGADLWPGI